MAQATESCKPVILRTEDGTLPPEWSQASISRGFNDPCIEAVIYPSTSTIFRNVYALLIVGIPSRRPYDTAQQAWVGDFHRTFADGVSSVVAEQQKAQRIQETARRVQLEKELYEKELALRRREAILATSKVQRMLGIMQSVE